MGDVPVLAVCRLLGGHGNEQPLLTFNYFNIVNDEHIVDRNRDDCFHLAFLGNFSYSYVCYLHSVLHFSILNGVTFASFDHDPHTIFSLIGGISLNGVATFYDAIFYDAVVPDVYIIQNKGIPDYTVITNINLME